MLTAAALNIAADAIAAQAQFASLHATDPGATGAGELSGGTPAYARKGVTWNAAAAGNADSSNQPVFDVPAGATVAFVGLWSAVTAGVFLGAQAVPPEVFGSQGTYTVTDIDIPVSAL